MPLQSRFLTLRRASAQASLHVPRIIISSEVKNVTTALLLVLLVVFVDQYVPSYRSLIILIAPHMNWFHAA